MKFAFILLISVCFISCATKYYVVRHAEKAPASGMNTDVLLTDAGQQRAIALKDALKGKHIKHIYSTNYARTKATANPLYIATGVPVEIYDPADSSFITKLKMQEGNTLIVGHSNTVDNLVNGLTGKNILQDLPDDEFGDLFIVKKRGSHYSFSKKHFGK